jgi:Reverse transcriptase (RNA-dependent DNA polymerase)
MIDLTSAYNQLWIKTGNEWKTAFWTNNGTYQYIMVPFGWSVEPAAFQRFFAAVLNRNNMSGITVYLGDISIFGDSDEELEERTISVENKLLRYNLRANLKKCEFHTREIEYVGFIMSSKCVKVADLSVNSIRLFEKPNSTKELCRFSGLINYLWKFVPDVSHKTQKLTKLLRTTEKVAWSNECDKA